jgi:hypothetical protein
MIQLLCSPGAYSNKNDFAALWRVLEEISGRRADRVQMESSGRVKMLEKQRFGASCVNSCERNTL